MSRFNSQSLKIAYFYPDNLNLYGDNGNVEILSVRAKQRGYTVEVLRIGLDTKIDSSIMSQVNVVFMGGGPDSEQKNVYNDLLENKGSYLKEYIDNGGMGLYICGSYQLLGKYYKTGDGTILDGLSAIDFYTEHFGNKKPRCIGNTFGRISNPLLQDFQFRKINHVGDHIVGFENHGGRTYLGKDVSPLAHVIQGQGNNSEDGGEGVFYKGSICTYYHGPLLARNPHIADYLIAKGLKVDTLSEVDDRLVLLAHTASQKLK